MNILPYLFALLAGAATALQVVINSQARLRLGLEHPLQATLLNFVIGTLIALVLCAVCGFSWPAAAVLTRAPWWIWTGGLLGIIYVSASVLLGPVLGVTLFLTLVLAGQLVGSMILDEFGILGTPVRAANLGRIAGIALVLAGALVMAWSTPSNGEAKPATESGIVSGEGD